MHKLFLFSCASLLISACSENNSPPSAVAPKTAAPVQQKSEPAKNNKSQISDKDELPLSYVWLNNNNSSDTPLANNLLATNYYVILDGSGSMANSQCSGSNTKMAVAQSSLSVFSQSVPQHANLGMISFDGRGIAERIPLDTNNREAFIREVNAVTPSSGTPLKSAIKLAYKKLIEQGRKQLGYGEYHLVVVTDGIASKNENPVKIINSLFKDSPVVLHTIGFCLDEKHSLNQPGRAYYKAANNPAALQAGLENVLAESDSFVITAFD